MALAPTHKLLLAAASVLLPGARHAHAQQIAAQSPGPTQTAVAPVQLDPAIRFLGPYGLGNFSRHYVNVLSATLRARAAIDADDHVGAKLILDDLWAQYPTGATFWTMLPRQPFGINIGTPPCYYALRMMSDTVDWHVANPGAAAPLRTAKLTVVLVGRTNGIEPRDAFEAANGTGVQVEHELEPALLAEDSRIVRESLALFSDYVVAMTGGTLGFETEILHLPDTDLPVQVTPFGSSGTAYVAGLESVAQVWPDVPDATRESTDWWWVLYPSHVPEQHPPFQTTEFITGGMASDERGAPVFLIDDRWLTRKPPHLGSGPYSDVERNIYLPQWLQHEFFHHLYRTYPEFGLEATSHQWFSLANWPSDFVGRFEPDYYHESVFRRLQGAQEPMAAALRYATDGAPWGQLNLFDVFGSYDREPVQNPWHSGVIQPGAPLRWQNQAGVSWNLTPDLLNGRLLTGPDNPYFGSPLADAFQLVLKRNALGDILPELAGFSFLGELYRR